MTIENDQEGYNRTLEKGLSQFPTDGLKRLIEKIEKGDPIYMSGPLVSPTKEYG